MTKLRFFLGLVRQLESASIELGLGSLTDSDRIVLIALWDVVDKKTYQSNLGYDRFAEMTEKQEIVVSRSQFFKSINKLEDLKLITRVGGSRSGTYQLRAE